jgi:hypothetical protein
MQLEKIPGQQAWHVHDDDGALIGKLEQRQLGRSARGQFWCAYGVHPETGAMICLELSADREERLRVIEDFQVRPEAYRQHWG